MSRIGKLPVPMPAGVSMTRQGDEVQVKGPKGTLTQRFPGCVQFDIEDTDGNRVIHVINPGGNPENAAFHGLSRALLSNMVIGVDKGFTKELEVSGVGYRAAKQGTKLILTVGFSHPVEMEEPEGIRIEVPKPDRIVVSGTDKQKVGQVAAKIREKRPPEPYKGKGIKYATETIRRKAGKAGKGK